MTKANKFSKVAEYKINTNELVVFLHTRNKQLEKEVKKTIPFTRVFKRIKYLRVNLTMKIKKLYTENYKILLK